MGNLAPIILAHRGARQYAPENTLPAFKKAIEMELDGVEFDVMSTSDGVPVVVHDDDLAQLTGQNIHVHKTTYAELSKIDVGRHFDPFYAGEQIPTLNEVLELFRPTSCILNIELKEQRHQPKGFMDTVVKVIDSYKMGGKIVVSSFSKGLMYHLGRKAPHIKRLLLIKPGAFFFLDVLIFANMLCVRGINPHISLLRKLLAAFVKARGWEMITWTANTAADVKRALALGVDGIITDEPLLVKEICGSESYGR